MALEARWSIERQQLLMFGERFLATSSAWQKVEEQACTALYEMSL